MPWQIIVLAILLQPVAAVIFAVLMRGADKHRVKVLKKERDALGLEMLEMRADFKRSYHDLQLEAEHLKEHNGVLTRETQFQHNLSLKHKDEVIHLLHQLDDANRAIGTLSVFKLADEDKHGILKWINPAIDNAASGGMSISSAFTQIGKSYKITIEPSTGVTNCTRGHHTEGPCNGWPLPGHPGCMMP
jgi:FtsZ-binding cell division protein ZapB